jgi:hypothetical protein
MTPRTLAATVLMTAALSGLPPSSVAASQDAPPPVPANLDGNRRQTIDAVETMSAGVGIFLFFMTGLGVITYVGRSILEHRRWLLAMRVQTDAHTKLVDRLASNEDLLAYVQSPAGQRFLSSSPLAIDGEVLPAGAPLGRILTSIQIGVVGAFGGLGLFIARNNVIEEVAQPLQVIATLAIALGAGFVLSAAIAFMLSRRFGLIRSSSNA